MNEPPAHNLDVLRLAMHTQETAFRTASSAEGTARIALEEARKLAERVAVLEQTTSRRTPVERFLQVCLMIVGLGYGLVMLAKELVGP